MFARVTTFTGSPEQIEAGLRLYRESALPWMREASGFRGFVALVDAERGRSVGITFWATRQAAEDGAGSGHELRQQIIDGFELTMESLDILEVSVAEGVLLDERDEG